MKLNSIQTTANWELIPVRIKAQIESVSSVEELLESLDVGFGEKIGEFIANDTWVEANASEQNMLQLVHDLNKIVTGPVYFGLHYGYNGHGVTNYVALVATTDELGVRHHYYGWTDRYNAMLWAVASAAEALAAARDRASAAATRLKLTGEGNPERARRGIRYARARASADGWARELSRHSATLATVDGQRKRSKAWRAVRGLA